MWKNYKREKHSRSACYYSDNVITTWYTHNNFFAGITANIVGAESNCNLNEISHYFLHDPFIIKNSSNVVITQEVTSRYNFRYFFLPILEDLFLLWLTAAHVPCTCIPRVQSSHKSGEYFCRPKECNCITVIVTNEYKRKA